MSLEWRGILTVLSTRRDGWVLKTGERAGCGGVVTVIPPRTPGVRRVVGVPWAVIQNHHPEPTGRGGNASHPVARSASNLGVGCAVVFRNHHHERPGSGKASRTRDGSVCPGRQGDATVSAPWSLQVISAGEWCGVRLSPPRPFTRKWGAGMVPAPGQSTLVRVFSRSGVTPAVMRGRRRLRVFSDRLLPSPWRRFGPAMWPGQTPAICVVPLGASPREAGVVSGLARSRCSRVAGTLVVRPRSR